MEIENNTQKTTITTESIKAKLPIIKNDPSGVCDWWLTKAESIQIRDKHQHDKNIIWYQCKDLLHMINTEVSNYKIPLEIISERYTAEELETLKNLPLDTIVDMVFDPQKVNEWIKALHMQYPKSLYWKMTVALGITTLFALYDPYSKEFYERVEERKPHIIKALTELREKEISAENI